MSALLLCPRPGCHRAWLRSSRPVDELDLLLSHLRRSHRLSEDEAAAEVVALDGARS